MLWPTMHALSSRRVVEFYGHGAKAGELACFSNFYQHEELPFTVPDCCWDQLLKTNLKKEDVPKRTVMVSFSEKSIMLCKAAAMGDVDSYRTIVDCPTPGKTKQLGRRVTPFDEDVWQSVVMKVGFEAVLQKFSQLDRENKTLRATGNALIVEAAPRDIIRGIGKPIGHANCQDPATWGRGNILGWALVKARNVLVTQQQIQFDSR